ncbi:hypothetical protein ScPMuIL_001746 [Solemya velum]
MATSFRKRRREIQERNSPDSFIIKSCGLGVKKRRRTLHALPRMKQDDKENIKAQLNVLACKPPVDYGRHMTTSKKDDNQGKRTLKRRVSMTLIRQKMKKFQDYSLPEDENFRYLRAISKIQSQRFLKGYRSGRKEDHDLQQKIDHEIKMREGTVKLLAASKHPAQMLEAAKNLLTSNNRILSYMTELQKRKTAEVLGRGISVEGNQLPCRATVSMSDIRIPLMWKDTDHFKNKGDYRRYAVFCLLKIGTEIYDTSLITNVDRSMTDISFEDVIVFNSVPHDFDCKFEVYSHKLHEDLTMASTPKKIRKKINDLSGSVGRSVGKRLSGIDDADIIGSKILGPRFELVASGSLQLQDVDDSVRTFDLKLEATQESAGSELPLFGHYCCRLAALPHCLTDPAVTGFLDLQEDSDLSKWKRYWCVLKNLQLACWSSEGDVEIAQPLLEIPVTKNTQISDADPRTSERSHTFHLKTLEKNLVLEHTLAAQSQEDRNRWWDGFQQHLLDQALWKHACDEEMDMRRATSRKGPVFLRKSSLYDDTPVTESTVNESIMANLKTDDNQLSKMLSTLMGEAKEIRGDQTQTLSS